MKTQRKHRDAEATRAALVREARRQFAEEGFAGARLHAIAARAGVNKAMISYYFGGKRGLFSEVILGDVRAARRHLQDADDPGAPPAARLDRFITSLADYLGSNPDLARILSREQMGGASNLDPEVRQEMFGFFRITRDILASGERRGVFRRTDPHATHMSLVGSLLYFLLTEPARETFAREGALPVEPPRWPHHVEQVRRLILSGLRPDDDERPGDPR